MVGLFALLLGTLAGSTATAAAAAAAGTAGAAPEPRYVTFLRAPGACRHVGCGVDEKLSFFK
jgi:hypothetical protein